MEAVYTVIALLGSIAVLMVVNCVIQALRHRLPSDLWDDDVHQL